MATAKRSSAFIRNFDFLSMGALPTATRCTLIFKGFGFLVLEVEVAFVMEEVTLEGLAAAVFSLAVVFVVALEMDLLSFVIPSASSFLIPFNGNGVV